MRNRFLSSLYNAFNRDPDSAVAFSLRHWSGLSWAVKDEVLTVYSGNGALMCSVELTGLVVNVIATLEASGLVVTDVHAGMLDLHASILVDGSGSEPSNIPSEIRAHRSVLWAIISGYAQEVKTAADAVPEAIKQATLSTAEGSWLDYWGGMFGVERPAGQTDPLYLSLIVSETLRARSNKYAIEKAILDATAKTVTIDEPWTRMFTLDVSELSGPDKIKDGETVGRNLIRPMSLTPIDWTDVIPVVRRNRAAGVLVLPPQGRVTAGMSVSLVGVVSTAISRSFTSGIPYGDRVRMDYEAIEDALVLNRDALWIRGVVRFSFANGSLSPVVSWAHSRAYRFYVTGVKFPSKNWGHFTWSSAGEETWASIMYSVSSGHTRT